MVELRKNDIQDFQIDAVQIAKAFRDASDDDTRTVLNLMSKPFGTDPSSSFGSLRFYAVPAEWFLRAWPVLMARSADEITDENWRESIGWIQNVELIDVERAVSDDEKNDSDTNDEGGLQQHEQQQQQQQQQQPPKQNLSKHEQNKVRIDQSYRIMTEKHRSIHKLKAGLVHTEHYFFLGPSAWTLVMGKFGFDGYELGRPCAVEGIRRTIAIELDPDATTLSGPTIEIPDTGRFAYEKVVEKYNENSRLGRNFDSRLGQPQDATDDGRNNIISCSDKEIDMSEAESDRPPVILLPPSTTAVDQDESDIGSPSPLFQVPDDDMDVESNDRGSADGSMNGTKNPHVSGRKRLASGLGNLGNTCFMNSTLQCLAHTEPIRRYFLSGEYEKDLNRHNPLGTGGELATQFANLLGEIWGVPSKRRNVLGSHEFKNHYVHSSTSAVYPRSFKLCLGKHAEQFMGYDQHDSQELATYLLDALHEDTNRVTKKPYVEKPEQGEDESDDDAADKAWRLHLQREDSRVLENFMGQVKSRLECCEEGCNRVSTTFDPFMYLSVPIPGACDRIMDVTFVPLDPSERIQSLSLTLPKTSTISGVMGKVNEELTKRGFCDEAIPLHDLVPVDVFTHEVFTWYKSNHEVDQIRDADKVFVYQVRPLEEIQEIGKRATESNPMVWADSTKPRLQLDPADETRLNGDKWITKLASFMNHYHFNYRLTNPKNSTHEERIHFYNRLDRFIRHCHTALEEEELRKEDERKDNTNEGGTTKDETDQSSRDVIDRLVELSNVSDMFDNIKTINDVAILEFCADKLKNLIIEFERDQDIDGVLIQVLIKRMSGAAHMSHRTTYPTPPIILRLPKKATVYDLRQQLALRMSRSLVTKQEPGSFFEETNAGESSAESSVKATSISTESNSSSVPPELLVMLQTALTYDRGNSRSSSFDQRLGMIDFDSLDSLDRDSPGIAVPTDKYEQESILDVVGNHGTVCINWTESFCDRIFDASEFETTESRQNDSSSSANDENQTITVLDCINKYCQKEQLEETEKWYCNKCQDHVRAWKQFHLYRTPPILIVHLKRFHYSPSTHRRDKINTYIDFPLEGLDLTELVSRYDEDDKPIYDCYAVSNHYGGLGGGHYTAYTLSDDGSWCYYDDSRVTTNVDKEKVVSEYAYVLYYRRRDVPVGHYQDCVYDGRISPMVCEQSDINGDPSEMSSNNTAQAGDMEVTSDDVASNASSRTATSPMGSVDNSDKAIVDNLDSLVHRDSDHRSKNAFPLQ